MTHPTTAEQRLIAARAEAERKAWEALARHKFIWSPTSRSSGGMSGATVWTSTAGISFASPRRNWSSKFSQIADLSSAFEAGGGVQGFQVL